MLTIQQARVFGRAVDAHEGAMRYASSLRYTEDTALPLVEAARALIRCGEMHPPAGWDALTLIEQALAAVAGVDGAEDALREARVRVCIHIAAQIVEASLTDADREAIALSRAAAAERVASWEAEYRAKAASKTEPAAPEAAQ